MIGRRKPGRVHEDTFKGKPQGQQKTRQLVATGFFFGFDLNNQTLVYGRGGGIRTRDPLHPMQVRYQAALRPEEKEYSRV